MRLLYLLFLLVLFAVSVSAQESHKQSDGSNVTVVQMKWRMEYHNPALDKDPVNLSRDRQDDRRRREVDRTNQILNDRGVPSSTSTTPNRSREPAQQITVTYIYELKVTNTGQKTIQSLNWEYLFSEPGTERELGRRRFESEMSISPGKTKTLIMRSSLPPTGTIDVRKSEKSREQYSEKVVIKSVSYTDGTEWQASSH